MSDRQMTTQERRREIRPSSSLYEEGGVITMRLEMPGVSKESMELEVEGNQLRIRGRRTAGERGAHFVVRERSEGDFSEVYTLDETVDRSKIDALMEDGVLTVTVHRREAEKPRKIQITSH
jgi:HSP20 family protein